MPAKEKRTRAPKPSATAPQTAAKLGKREEDLLRHMANGYVLETSPLRDNPILRNVKDKSEVRADASRRTIEALQQRGLIEVAKEGSVIEPTIWRLSRKGRQS
jgi:hypothetical protein